MRRNLYDVPYVEYDDDKFLYVENKQVRPHIRVLRELKEVLYDKDFADKSDPSTPLYYMYRDVKRENDVAIFDAAQLRFDITIVEPLHLGIERNKTLGHYHKVGLEGFSYPELYEVIEGEADFILQQVEQGHLIEVVLVRAKQGDMVFIPPGYWHVTVNASDKLLVMSNLVYRGVEGEYDPVRNHGGVAYFELLDGSFLANRIYEEIPPIKHVNPRQTFEKVTDGKLYPQFIKDHTRFEFLTRLSSELQRA